MIALARAWQRVAGGHRQGRSVGVLVPSALMLLGLATTVPGEDFTPPDSQSVQAQAKIAEAVRERIAGHLVHARALCEEALLLQPGSADARLELARIDALASGHDQGATPSEVNPASEALKRQVALADERIAADQAELLAAEGRTAEAVATLEPAINALTEYRLELTPEQDEELTHLKAVDEKLRVQSGRDQEEARRLGRQQDLTVAQKAANAQISQGRSALAERISRIQDMRDRSHLEQALEAVRRLLIEYPEEPQVDTLFREILSAVHEQRRLTLAEEKLEGQKELMQRIEESMLPEGIDGNPVFPTGWLARHSSLGGLEARPEVPLWKEALLDRLAKTVTVDFEGDNGLDALHALASQTGLNVVIDPSLQTGDSHPITLKAANMRLENVVDWITREMSTTWQLLNGAVYIGGSQEVPGVLSVYDISSLLFQGGDQPGRTLGFAVSSGSSGKGLFKTETADTKQNSPEDVVDLLQKTISPDTWKDANYSIAVHDSALFVNAPPAIHEQIRQFIAAQEKQRSLQVRVDARWLEIDDSYIEEIGVSWGNILQNSLLGNAPQANAAYPLSGVYNEGSFRSYQGNATSILPATSVEQEPQVQGTGLNFSIARLGTTMANAVMTAVERESRGRILSSPTLVTLNGVQASCFFGQEIAYISTYNVVSSLLEPQIDVLNIGASLVVRPQISADHKYVTMELRPALASAVLFEQILDAPYVLNTVSATGILGYVDYPIELPNVTIREVGTTVQVPDHGSLLIGGFNGTIDQTADETIPFIGNVPFVGRLFGTRGRYSQRSKLYLLATVSIITYDELEATQ